MFQNTNINVLNKEFFQKLIGFLSQINTKIDEILVNWNNELTIANSKIKDLLNEKERLEG